MERSLTSAFISCAKENPQRVVFPEAQNDTMFQAVCAVLGQGIAEPILIGNRELLTEKLNASGISPNCIRIIEPTDEDTVGYIADKYASIDGAIFGPKAARRRLKDPLNLSMALVSTGDADVAFAGIEASTGEVILAAQSFIGLEEGIMAPSSFGIFDIPEFAGSEGTLLAFGDSAVCANPTYEQLASIAISCCDSVADLMGWNPRCALLSYSTAGSADGELVEKVRLAIAKAQQLRPDLAIDGEFQLDAALDPLTAKKKVPRESTVAGKANIVVWPDLNAGNLMVKGVQLFAKGPAYGPLLQGFKRIVCDCSRSASVEEIVGNIAMSCVRASAHSHRVKESL